MQDICKIGLTKNKIAIIDKKYEEAVNKNRWLFHHGYAQRRENGKRIQLANFIWDLAYPGTRKGFIIDHHNGDPLDNRLCNLKKLTASQNNINIKIKCNNKTGVTGVYHNKTKCGYGVDWMEDLVHKYKFFTYGRKYRDNKEIKKKYKNKAIKFRTKIIKTNPNYLKALTPNPDYVELGNIDHIEVSNRASILPNRRTGIPNIGYYERGNRKFVIVQMGRNNRRFQKTFDIGPRYISPTYEIAIENAKNQLNEWKLELGEPLLNI